MTDINDGASLPQQVPQSDPAQEQLQRSLTPAFAMNPDEMARYQRIAAKTGIDPYLMSQDPNVRQRAAALAAQSDVSFDGVINTSPSTATFLSNPQHADVAHDDVDNLSLLERSTRSFFGLVASPAASLYGMLPWVDAQGKDDFRSNIADATLGDTMTVAKAMARGLPAGAAKFGAGVYGAAEAALNAGSLAAGKVFFDPIMARWLGWGGEMAGEIRQGLEDTADRLQGDTSNLGSVGGGMVSGSQSVGGVLAALPFGIGSAYLKATQLGMAGGEAAVSAGGEAIAQAGERAGLGIMSASSGGETYGAAKDRGVPENRALAAGMINGLLEYATEKLPADVAVHQLFANGVKEPLGKAFVEFTLKDIFGEQLATASEDASDQWLTPDGKTWKDYWAERPAAAFQTLIATATMAGMVGTAAKIHRIYDQNYGATAQARQVFDAMVNGADNSNLAKRMPEKMVDFIEQVRADSNGHPNVYIDAQAFKDHFERQGIDPYQAARDMAGSSFNLDDAIQRGGDVVVPVSSYIANVVNTGHHTEGLRDLIRFRQGDLSIADQRDQEEVLKKQMRDIADNPDAAAVDDSPVQRIYDEFFGEQIRAGIAPLVAHSHAVLVATRYAARAEQLKNTDAYSLWREDSPIQITNESSKVTDEAGNEIPIDEALDALREQIIAQVEGDRKPKAATVEASPETGDQAAPEAAPEAAPASQDAEPTDDTTRTPEAATQPEAKPLFGLDNLQRELKRRGINVTKASNDEIKKALESPAPTPEAQSAQRTLNQPSSDAPRATLAFRAGVRQVTLHEGQDLSSMVHELGHMWLEELRKDATREDASDQLKADWATVKKALGLAGDGEIPTAAHEQFATWSEQYIREGRSPVKALQAVFAKLRDWMLSVYKTASDLGAQMPDEVREVFDRLLAGKEQVDAALEISSPMLHSPEQLGLSQEEWDAYRKLTEQDREEAYRNIHDKLLEQARRSTQRWWKAEATRIRNEVTDDVRSTPVYRAMREMASGKDALTGEPLNRVKLDKDELIQRYGQQVVRRLSPQVLRTPGSVMAEDGTPLDDAASLFGFTSGDEMVRAMLSSPPEAEAIDQEVKRRMEAAYGNIADRTKIDEASFESVASDARLAMLEKELQILKRKQIEVQSVAKLGAAKAKAAASAAVRRLEAKLPREFLQYVATREVERQTVGDLDPESYRVAGDRAAAKAIKAAMQDKYDEAIKAKQQQITNLYLYKAARAAQADVQAADRFMRKMTKTPARAALGKAGPTWLEQADTILRKYEYLPPAPVPPVPFDQFAKRVEDEFGITLPTSDALIVATAADSMSYKEEQVGKFLAARDSLKALDHVARRINKVNVKGKEVAREEAVKGLITRTKESLKRVNKVPVGHADMSYMENLRDKNYKVWASLKRPEKLFEVLDGGREGLWHDIFWNPIADASGVKQDWMHKVSRPVVEFQKKLGRDWESRMNERVFIPSLGQSMMRRALIGVALNVGNDSNYAKLAGGGIWFGEHFTGPLSDAQIQEMIDQLNEQEWAFVRLLWDSCEMLYEPLNELNQRVTGLPLKRVVPRVVMTKFGPVPGGYWQAVPDPSHHSRNQRNDDKIGSQMFYIPPPMAASPATSRHERTDAVYPIQLDWGQVFTAHVDRSTNDIAYTEVVSQLYSIMRTTPLRETLRVRAGVDSPRLIDEWLTNLVNPQTAKLYADSQFNTTIRGLQSNVAIAALGFKVGTAIGNMITGPIQSFHQLNPFYWLAGVKHVLTHRDEAIEEMQRVSSEMRYHTENMYSLIDDAIRQTEASVGWRAQLAHFSMLIHRTTEHWVSATVWWGKYTQEMARVDDHERAVRLADKTVRTTQMTSAPKDLSAWERSPSLKAYSQFLGPMLVMQNELRGEIARASGGYGFSPKSLANPKVWAALFTTCILPSVIFDLVSMRGPDWDDEEEVKQWFTVQIMTEPFKMIPLVREAVPAVVAAVTGKKSGVGKNNILADYIEKSVMLAHELHKEDSDAGKIVNLGASFAGVAFGLPTSQPGIALQFATDVASGRYEPKSVADGRYLLFPRDRSKD